MLRASTLGRLLIGVPLVALILLVVGTARADSDASGAVVSLEPLWRIHPGDLEDCGAVGASDAGFLSVEEFSKLRSPPAAACLRAEITRADDRLAISFTSQVAYILFVNGVEIARDGDIATGRGAHFGPPNVVPIPAAALRPDGTTLVASRTRIPATLRWVGSTSRFDDVLVGDESVLRARRGADGLTPSLSADLAVAIVYGLLGAFHLAMYRRRRKLREYLDLGLAMLFFAGWTVRNCAVHASVGVGVDQAVRFSALGYGLCIFLLDGTWRLLRRDPVPSWIRALQVFLLVLAVPHAMSPPDFARVVPYGVVMFAMLATAVAGLALEVREGWRGNPEARTLLFGSAAFLACFLPEVVRVLLGIEQTGAWAIASLGSEAGMVCYALAFALALANRFSRSLEALDEAYGELALTYDAAARFVPTDLLRILGHASIRDVRLGDQVAHPMSTLFCDIRGFSALAERLGAARTFEIINRYLSFMEPVVHAHRGLILQFLGDGIMVLFPGAADDAVRGAIAMHDALASFNADTEKHGDPPVAIGIGINTGSVMVGTIGGRDRLDSSVIGDAVNLASRIEGMTKMYGVSLLLGEGTVRALERRGDFVLREVDRVVAKGTTQGVSIYEVVDVLPEAERASRGAHSARYAAALDALKRGDFQTASDGFRDVTNADPSDSPAVTMAARARELVASPPPSWTGATPLTTK